MGDTYTIWGLYTLQTPSLVGRQGKCRSRYNHPRCSTGSEPWDPFLRTTCRQAVSPWIESNKPALQPLAPPHGPKNLASSRCPALHIRARWFRAALVVSICWAFTKLVRSHMVEAVSTGYISFKGESTLVWFGLLKRRIAVAFISSDSHMHSTGSSQTQMPFS